MYVMILYRSAHTSSTFRVYIICQTEAIELQTDLIADLFRSIQSLARCPILRPRGVSHASASIDRLRTMRLLLYTEIHTILDKKKYLGNIIGLFIYILYLRLQL